MPLLVASVLVGLVVLGVGIYRAHTQGQFMPMVLGMLILMSCAANYLKRREQVGDSHQGEDEDSCLKEEPEEGAAP